MRGQQNTGKYTYDDALRYLTEARDWPVSKLLAARRSVLRDKHAGIITADECLDEAHLINLAIDLKTWIGGANE